jgi:glycosylphosphatidylinositol transamidase (GPIT) subunit GPI8
MYAFSIDKLPVLQLQSPGVVAVGSSMKGENSYSHHLDPDVSTKYHLYCSCFLYLFHFYN